MISTASPPPLRIPPNRQDTPPAEPAKKFKSLRLALYGSNPGYSGYDRPLSAGGVNSVPDPVNPAATREGFRGDGRPGMVRPAFRAQGTARSGSTSFAAWQPPPWSTE